MQVAASPEAAGLSHFDSETFGHECGNALLVQR